MKTLIKHIFLLSLIGSCLFISCKKQEFSNPDLSQDNPRILSNWPPKTANGLPGEFNTLLNEEFDQQIIYTPVELSTCTWYLDGVEMIKGDTFKFTPTETGKYYLKVIVRTADKQTFREANVIVSNP